MNGARWTETLGRKGGVSEMQMDEWMKDNQEMENPMNYKNQSHKNQSRALAGLAFATALCASLPVSAEIFANDVSRTEYFAYVNGMPDLDQVRNPENWGPERHQGLMYCGPTSAANVLSYFVHEGVSSVDAPTVDFEPIVISTGMSGREELRATVDNLEKNRLGDDFIAELADEMDTGAFSQRAYDTMSLAQKIVRQVPLNADDYIPGTSRSDLVAAFEDRLPDGFSAYTEGGKECSTGSRYTITPRRIFEHFEAGHQLILNLGFYDDRGGDLERHGGHYVVVTGVLRTTNDDFVLWYRDPAQSPLGDTSASQGAFETESTDLVRSSITLSGASGCTRTRWHMVDRTSGNSYIDGLIVIAPPGT
jgi:hypothetical protein